MSDTFDSPELITFDALQSWSYPRRRQHQYAFISDVTITETLENDDLSDVDLAVPWDEENSSTKQDNPIHIARVAKLVNSLRQGEALDPIKIVAEAHIRDQCQCCYCVIDGHHRLRALIYLERRRFLAVLRGNPDALAELRCLVGTVGQ